VSVNSSLIVVFVSLATAEAAPPIRDETERTELLDGEVGRLSISEEDEEDCGVLGTSPSSDSSEEDDPADEKEDEDDDEVKVDEEEEKKVEECSFRSLLAVSKGYRGCFVGCLSEPLVDDRARFISMHVTRVVVKNIFRVISQVIDLIIPVNAKCGKFYQKFYALA